MVMVPVSDLGDFVGDSSEVKDHSWPDAEFSALRAEILRRVEVMSSNTEAGSPIDIFIVEAALDALRGFAEEVENPCESRLGKDIDPWDDRIRLLREMAAVASEVMFKSVSEEAELTFDDPRSEKLRLVVTKVAAIISETLEASIEAVKPGNAPSACRPTI